MAGVVMLTDHERTNHGAMISGRLTAQQAGDPYSRGQRAIGNYMYVDKDGRI